MLINWIILSITIFGFTNGLPNWGRVVGGEDAEPGEFPYQVSLQNYGRHFCGGSILSKSYILTAAHCVDGSRPSEVTVHVGTHNLNKGGTKHSVAEIIVHEQWSDADLEYDIAILLLEDELVFNDTVQPINIASHDIGDSGHPAILSGWGRISNSGPAPRALQKLNVQVYDHEKCVDHFGGLYDGNICTFTKKGEGACFGDSGGPLVADGVQIGLASFISYGCAYGYPDVFTRTYFFRDWVMEKIL